MQQVMAKETAKGEFIKRKPESNRVYVRGHYDRASKSYSFTAFDDISCEIFIKANKPVFIGFEF